VAVRSATVHSFSAAWFGVAIAASTATQLRKGPVGPGELMLLLWLAYRFAEMMVQRTIVVPREGRPLLWFWCAAPAMLAAGWLAKILSGYPQRNAALYDTFAFTFTAAAIVVFLLERDLRERVRTAAATMLLTAVVGNGLLAAATVVGPGAGPLRVWYGMRLAGWAANPNQLALLMLGMPLIALQLRSQSGTRARRLVWLAFTLAAAVLGVATLSDSLIIAWTLGGAVLACLALVRAGSVRTGSVLRAGLMRVVLPLLVLVSAGAVAPRLVAKVTEEAGELSGSAQGSDRLEIWGHALEAMATSPIVGLGPGSHAWHDAPGEGYEAHNSYLDWGTSTGIVGLAAYLALLAWAGLRALRDRSHYRVVLLLSLMVFSTFHYVLRQPTFWFTLLVVAVAPAGSRLVRAPAAAPRPARLAGAAHA
jgi:O-antigen ligase